MSTRDRLDWHRLRGWFDESGWIPVWHTVYLVTLAAGTFAASLDRDLGGAERAAIVALALLSAGWYLLISVRWRYWQAPPLQFALLLAVAAALWVPLIRWHPAFGITVFAAYGVAACPWLRRAIPSVVALTILLLVAQHTDGTPLTVGELAGLVAIGALVLLAHATIGAVTRESERRRVLIEELEAARADLAASERAAGVLEERQRLAREIHDGLAQGFTSIVTLLEAADARLPADAVDARAAIDQARQAARDSLAEARRLVWALRPDQHDGAGALVAALERLAVQTRAGGRLGVEVVITGEPQQLDALAELTVLRTAQESVANAVRHADATEITLTLSWLGDRVALDVADNGSGFDPKAVSGPRPDGSGFGLTSLQERATACGATLEFATAPGEGTTVTLTAPTRPETEPPETEPPETEPSEARA